MLTAVSPAGAPAEGPDPLPDVFSEPSRWRLRRGDLDAYQELRVREPQLVSLVDGKPNAGVLEALVLWEGGRLQGAVSYLVQVNLLRPPGANRFARIDIVVVPPESRGLGLGHLLLASVTAHLLRSQGELLYSISCLAAHPAVAHTLEAMGFVPGARDHLHYVHEELRLEPGAVPALAARFSREAATALRRASYTLRQRRSGAPR